MYIIVYGNIFDGLEFVGPFSDRDSALLYSEGDSGEWHIVELQPPPSEWNVADEVERKFNSYFEKE
jgi:hypothetical protein